MMAAAYNMGKIGTSWIFASALVLEGEFSSLASLMLLRRPLWGNLTPRRDRPVMAVVCV